MLTYTNWLGYLDEVVFSLQNVDSDLHLFSLCLLLSEFVNSDENVVDRRQRTPKVRVPISKKTYVFYELFEKKERKN